MRIDVAEIAGSPPRGSILIRPTGRRAAGDAAGSDSRTIAFVASDSSVGRDGHRILADAWRTEEFLQNPVFLFAHLDDQPPVGKVISLRTVGDQLRAIVRFAEAETYAFADTVYRLYVGGYLNACSTGWLPRAWKASNDRSRPGGVDFTDVTLLELSGVPVPALPSALATARAAGVDLAPFVEWTERALDTGRSIYPEKQLMSIRSAAGAPRPYAAARTTADRIAAAQRYAKPGADPASGFRSLGEFLQTVARAAPGVEPDSRLVRAPTGLSLDDPSGGGSLAPTVYLEQLVGSIYEEAVLAPRCRRLETDRPNDCRLPGIDETSRADGSRWGGVLSYWNAEAGTVPASLPRFRQVTFSATKLFGVCAATAELLADAPMLEAYVRMAFAAELGFKFDAAIFAGQGAGQPLGIMNAPALITVAKRSGQASATIVPENIEDMWNAMLAPCRRRAVWLTNESAEFQLSSQLLAAGNAGALSASQASLYIPTGAAGNEYPLLKGRPVLAIEQAPAIGAPGDIVLADLSAYATVESPLRAELSLDVKFLTDEGVFRFAWRVDGQPLFKSPITDYNTSTKRSPFVALAQR